MTTVLETNPSTPRTPCLCFRMRRAAQRIKDFYDETLAPAGITTAQYSLLVNISRREGCGTGELARVLQHEKSTLVRTLQPLLHAGLIVDRSPESDRKRQLYLTEAGKAVLGKAVPLWNKAQDEVRTRLGDEPDQLIACLNVLDQL